MHTGEVQTLRVTVPSRLEEIGSVNDVFHEFSVEHGLPDDIRRGVKIVFDDLLNNVISYAYKDDEEHTIEVRVELSADRLVVHITDDGHAFNPFARAAPDTELDLEDREIGGLGIHIVENLMDVVSYIRQDDQNVVVLVKYLAEESTMENPDR